MKTIEAWAAEKRVEPVWFRAAFVREKWCEGLELSEANFDAAIEAARDGV